MAKKRPHSCCGKRFNSSGLAQHNRDKHPGRKLSQAKPRRSWRSFFAGFSGAAAGVLVALSIWQYGAPLMQEAKAQTTGFVKAVHVSRK
jgi:hypothetical protein